MYYKYICHASLCMVLEYNFFNESDDCFWTSLLSITMMGNVADIQFYVKTNVILTKTIYDVDWHAVHYSSNHLGRLNVRLNLGFLYLNQYITLAVNCRFDIVYGILTTWLQPKYFNYFRYGFYINKQGSVFVIIAPNTCLRNRDCEEVLKQTI